MQFVQVWHRHSLRNCRKHKTAHFTLTHPIRCLTNRREPTPAYPVLDSKFLNSVLRAGGGGGGGGEGVGIHWARFLRTKKLDK